MSHLLNYKYEIFPTRPQRGQLNRILREAKIQWNKAVTFRRKLKRSLASSQIEHIIETCLSSEKNNEQANRRNAILKFQRERFPDIPFDSAARLYDINNLAGKFLNIEPRHLDVEPLAKELKDNYRREQEERKKARTDGAKPPKAEVYWALMRAINRYAGFEAKRYMDKTFKAPGKMALSTVRFNVSGSANSIRWNQAVQPKKGQRTYGATGEPRYKRRGEGFAFQIPQKTEIQDLIRDKKKAGHQIHISALHEGNSWIDMAYHRAIPVEGKIKQLTVNARAGRYFAVLSAEVPDSAWRIAPMGAGWHAGVDPGAQTALTVALQNTKTGKLGYLAIHYGFLEKSLGRLEKMQQALALKQGPRRKRTRAEIDTELNRFKSKKSFVKLTPPEQEKSTAKKEKSLETRMIRQDASNKWRRWSRTVSALQMRVANQRADVLHKISRAFAEGCDAVGIGHWEPEREISYRKKIKAAKKKTRLGVDGAADELKSLLEEKSKQGPKGAVKRRRGGRDRSIATLRRLVEEKASRAGVKALTDVNEAYSTMTCCVCGTQTGPKKDLSIREWRCKECNAFHHRDLNSGFNILKKMEHDLAAAQAASPETEATVTRNDAQGATDRAGGNPGSRATGPSWRGDSFFQGHGNAFPDLWDKDAPRAVRSLIQMGIIRPLSLQACVEKSAESSP